MNKEELRDLILREAEKGNIVFMTIEGAMTVNLNEIIEQPTEGFLYDLNRDKATILTLLDDPKWVNDFAVALVIERLKEEITRLQQWVNDLHTDMYINCVYCGHRYGPDPGTPVAMADILKEHIEQCSEHPLSKAKTEIETMQPVIDAAKAFVNQAMSFQEWLKTGDRARSSHELYRLLKTAVRAYEKKENKK